MLCEKEKLMRQEHPAKPKFGSFDPNPRVGRDYRTGIR